MASEPEALSAASGTRPAPVARAVDGVYRVIVLSGGMLAAICLLKLALRAALRVELRWDAFWYHIPFAAKRGGIPVAYDFLPYTRHYFEGFPPLAEIVQGALWRLTGSIYAAGVANYLALVLFLAFAVRKLKASWACLAVLCLTAPLVVIHAATSYNDLFANALLAIGLAALLHAIVYEQWSDGTLLAAGLLGTLGAAWSKYTAAPICACIFLCYAGYYSLRKNIAQRRRWLAWVGAAMVFAAIPYARNVMVYRNPIWPFRPPILGDRFPYTLDDRTIRSQQTPSQLAGASQPELFFRSLFEIGHPKSYPNRERWTLDQGNDASIAFRSGGFWAVGIATAMVAAIVFATLADRRRGIKVAAAIAVILGVTSILPESYSLRYYLFLPLTFAALAATSMEPARRRYPVTVLAVFALMFAEFVWMTKVNRAHYRIEKIGWRDAAVAWGVEPYWGRLQRGKTYCAVGFEPVGFLLTGPTMREFSIIDRDGEKECPAGVEVIRKQQAD